jgi:uncharacterized repeat protein (TIGR01451 family)
MGIAPKEGANMRFSPISVLATFMTVVGCFSNCSIAAEARPNVKLILRTDAVVFRDGKTSFVSLPPEGIKRGERLRYTIVASNSGDKSALQFEPVGHIPAGAAFVANSATSSVGAFVEYTLDGMTWSAKPTIRVKNPNGSIVTKLADPSDYRAVRWTVKQLDARKNVTFAYEVHVK